MLRDASVVVMKASEDRRATILRSRHWDQDHVRGAESGGLLLRASQPAPDDAPGALAPSGHRQAHDGVPPAAVRGEFLRGVKAIVDVDKRSYAVLRNLVAPDAVENLGGKRQPVQWEDIVWTGVNGKRCQSSSPRGPLARRWLSERGPACWAG